MSVLKFGVNVEFYQTCLTSTKWRVCFYFFINVKSITCMPILNFTCVHGIFPLSHDVH